jgi:hypothetical protein
MAGVFLDACRAGKLADVIATYHAPALKQGVSIACFHGHLAVVKHLYPHSSDICDVDTTIFNACRGGHIHILDFFLNNTTVGFAHLHEGLIYAIKSSHIHVIKYLLRRALIIDAHECIYAAFFSKTHVIQIIELIMAHPHKRDTPINWLQHYIRAIHVWDGSMECLDYTMARYGDLESMILRAAASWARDEILEYVITKCKARQPDLKVPWNAILHQICMNATDNVHVLPYIIRNMPKIGPETWSAKIQWMDKYHIKLVTFILDQLAQYPDYTFDWISLIERMDGYLVDIEVIKFVYDRYKHLRSDMTRYVYARRPEVVVLMRDAGYSCGRHIVAADIPQMLDYALSVELDHKNYFEYLRGGYPHYEAVFAELAAARQNRRDALCDYMALELSHITLDYCGYS